MIDMKEQLKLSNNLKYDVRNLVSETTRSADKITNEAVPSCDAFRMSFLLGDADEARGAVGVLIKLYPEDKEIKQMWNDATGTHIRAYQGRDKFNQLCECKKKVA